MLLLSWLRHELEEGTFENVFRHKEIVTNATVNGTSKVSTKMTHNVQTGSEFFTALIKGLGGSTNIFNLIKVHCRLQVPSNEGVNIKHEVINGLGCLSIRCSMPNNTKATAKDTTKLGARIAIIVKIQTVVMSCIEKLIYNVKEKLLV